MYSIVERINLVKPVSLLKSIFRNDELVQAAVSKFVCCDCSLENKLVIVPYESGFPIFQIYNEGKVLDRMELLENKLVSKTSNWMLHLGELTVNDLPTLYFGINCPSCNSKYLCVFGYGEIQPGLTLLEISGVWKYEIIKIV